MSGILDTCIYTIYKLLSTLGKLNLKTFFRRNRNKPGKIGLLTQSFLTCVCMVSIFFWHWSVDNNSNSIRFQVIELLQNIMTDVCAGGWKRTAFSQANSTNTYTARRALSGWTRPKGWRMCFVATIQSSWVTGWVPPLLSLFGTKPLTLPTIGLSTCDGEHRSNLILPHKEEFKLAVLISFSNWSFLCVCCLLDLGFLCIGYLYSIVGSSTD